MIDLVLSLSPSDVTNWNGDTWDATEMSYLSDNVNSPTLDTYITDVGEWIRFDLKTSQWISSIFVLAGNNNYYLKDSCFNSGCIPPFPNLSSC